MRAKERLPRKHYSPEFKMELVRLALEEEGSIAALARKHDVNEGSGSVKGGSVGPEKTHRRFLP